MNFNDNLKRDLLIDDNDDDEDNSEDIRLTVNINQNSMTSDYKQH